jgi:protein-L-isoaspartate(D-aspartate) O-methyltransferase
MDKRSWEDLVQGLVREGILRSPNVIKALQRVSREQFLPENMKSYAAVDTPLPIGWGQTVSAPLSRPI